MVGLLFKYKDKSFTDFMKISRLYDLYNGPNTKKPIIIFSDELNSNKTYRYAFGDNYTSYIYLKINYKLYDYFEISKNIEFFKLIIENAINEQAIEEL